MVAPATIPTTSNVISNSRRRLRTASISCLPDGLTALTTSTKVVLVTLGQRFLPRRRSRYNHRDAAAIASLLALVVRVCSSGEVVLTTVWS